MKVRTGFVSNSSSSSFCIVVAKDKYEKAANKCSEFVQFLLNHKTKYFKVHGKDTVLLSGFMGEMADYESELIGLFIQQQKESVCKCSHCGCKLPNAERKMTADDREALNDELYDEATDWISDFEEELKKICKPDEYISEGEAC